jgi:hypothetical protein
VVPLILAAALAKAPTPPSKPAPVRPGYTVQAGQTCGGYPGPHGPPLGMGAAIR